jgi:hypothetical protein
LTYLSAVLMTSVALALAYARRRHRAEAATILVVAFPVALSVAHNATHAYQSIRANYRLEPSTALVLAPPVVATHRNLPLAQHALASITPDGTYAVVPHFRAPGRTAAARRERAQFRYVDSWLQYWLAPRIRTNSRNAQWLILLDAAEKPLPPGAAAAFVFGDDVLVRTQ